MLIHHLRMVISAETGNLNFDLGHTIFTTKSHCVMWNVMRIFLQPFLIKICHRLSYINNGSFLSLKLSSCLLMRCQQQCQQQTVGTAVRASVFRSGSVEASLHIVSPPPRGWLCLGPRSLLPHVQWLPHQLHWLWQHFAARRTYLNWDFSVGNVNRVQVAQILWY